QQSPGQPSADTRRSFVARDDAAQQAVAPAASSLHGVLTSPGRKFAIIDGVTVQVGGVWQEGRLVELTESSAVLRKNGQREVLRMYPQVVKKPIRRAPASREQTER